MGVDLLPRRDGAPSPALRGSAGPPPHAASRQDADTDTDTAAAAAAAAAPGTPAPPVPGWSLSPSRAADFKACPLRYRFRVIDRLPEAPSAAATRGTVVHGVLERLLGLPRADRTPAAAAALLPQVWADHAAQAPELADLFVDAAAEEAWLASAAALLERYFTLEDPRLLRTGSTREQAVQTVLPDGLTLRGIVDRMDRGAHGELRIVDYKTGRAPHPEREATALFQLRFYALVVWRSTGVVPQELVLLYLGDGVSLRYRPDEADLLATERQVVALAAAVADATRAGDFRPQPGWVCRWCDHQALCPAFDGTPPDYPQPPAE